MKISHLAPNQTVVEIDDKIVFQSYNTIVCEITDDVIKITEGQPQSKTTAKHLNQFLRMYTKFDNYKEI